MRAIAVVDGKLECRRCGQALPVEGNFYRDKTYPCGYDPRCKACQSKRTAERNARPEVKTRNATVARARYMRPEVRQQRSRQHQEWIERRPEYRLWYCAKERAALSGVAFTIAVTDVVVPLVCPLLGVTLRRNSGSRGPCPESPTLDRIDPKRGYEPDNVWVVSCRGNAIKNNASPDELERIASALRSRLLAQAGAASRCSDTELARLEELPHRPPLADHQD